MKKKKYFSQQRFLLKKIQPLVFNNISIILTYVSTHCLTTLTTWKASPPATKHATHSVPNNKMRSTIGMNQH